MIPFEGKFARTFLAGLLAPLASSCASTAIMPIHPVWVPDDSHRLVEVVHIGTKEEIVGNRKEIYDQLLASGIPEQDIGDGSVAVGFVFCCGKRLAQATRNLFYVPKDLHVELGDVVEIKSGRLPRDGNPGTVNRAVKVRQKVDATVGVCRWDPPDQKLEQVLYCEWMPTEGWTFEPNRIPLGATQSWIKKQ